MKRRLVAGVALIVALNAPTAPLAHELDEYLQAALISPEKDHIDIQLRLVPGAALFEKMFAVIDTNADAALSAGEKDAYVQRVVHDLAFTLNGRPLTPTIASASFPAIDTMKEGLGEIHIALQLPAPTSGVRQKLVFENHHRSPNAAYLVNCLLPQDRSIKIVGQRRSEDQSRYELDYE